MLLAVAVPPLASTGRGIDQVRRLGSDCYVEDLAVDAWGVIPAIGFAGWALEAGLLAFFHGSEVIICDGPVLALLDGCYGVGVPASFHAV